jgi:hypothetical protein
MDSSTYVRIRYTVPERYQVLGGEPPGVAVAGADHGRAAAGDGVQADRGDVPAEQFGDLGVLLDLRGRRDDPVDAPLDERAHDVGAVRAADGQVPGQHRVPVTAGLLLDGDGRLGDGVRPVAKLAGDGEDPLGGLRGHAHVAAVQHFAGRLEADARPGRHFLQRHVLPPRHLALPPFTLL